MAASVFGRTIGSESGRSLGRSLVLLVARLKDRLSLTFFLFFFYILDPIRAGYETLDRLHACIGRYGRAWEERRYRSDGEGNGITPAAQPFRFCLYLTLQY
jgi:hypothetical protein